jgi:hypothetical protein
MAMMKPVAPEYFARSPKLIQLPPFQAASSAPQIADETQCPQSLTAVLSGANAFGNSVVSLMPAQRHETVSGQAWVVYW